MRIIRFIDESDNVRLGRLEGDNSVILLQNEGGEAVPEDRKVSIRHMLAPVEPKNIICIGANYAAHAAEAGRDVPEKPIIFMKPTSAINHPGQPIRIPKCGDPEGEVDYECELAVVIGKDARDVSQEDALSYVLGYTCANDVSARKWQKHGSGGQWVRGKGFDTFCPMGPVLVTPEDIPDPQCLNISTTINGEVLQSANTRDMIFDVKFLISYLSQDTTLQAGTVLLTGTCEGVGAARDPKRWLVPGDEVTIEIEGIGKLTNPVIGPND